MSTPIKPPGNSPVEGPASTETEGNAAPEEVSKKFSEAVDKAEEALQSGAPIQGQATEVVQNVAEQLQAGTINPEQAVQQLLDHAMQNGGAGLLDETQRAELQSWLSQALENDPNLLALIKGLKPIS